MANHNTLCEEVFAVLVGTCLGMVAGDRRSVGAFDLGNVSEGGARVRKAAVVASVFVILTFLPGPKPRVG